MPFPSGSLPPISPTVGQSVNNNGGTNPPPVQIQNTPPPSPLPPESPPPTSSSVPLTKILMGLIPLFAFIVTGVISYSIVNNRNRPTTYQSKASEITPSAALVSQTPINFDIAMVKKTLDWLETQKNENGVYYLSEMPYSDTDKSTRRIDGRAGVYAIWGKFNYWQKTNDATVLSGIQTDLATYNNPQKIKTFQPDFWSCKLLYDLSQESSLKDAAKNLCWRSAIVIEDLSTDNMISENTVIKTIPAVDLNTVFSSQSDTQPTPEEKATFNAKFNQYASLSSDFSAKYLWANNQKNMEVAKALFNLAANIYAKYRTFGFLGGACPLGQAALDLYSSTSDTKYLNFAQEVFKHEASLEKQIVCGIFASNLNKAKPSDIYQQTVAKIVNNAGLNSYDATSGAFFSGSRDNQIRTIRDNSLIIKLLIDNIH